MLGDVDVRIWVYTGVECVEVGLESLWSETGRVQGRDMYRSGKALNRHGRRYNQHLNDEGSSDDKEWKGGER